MNFWEAQARARSKTTFYLSVFVFITVAIAVISELAMRYFAPEAYTTNIPLIGLGFIIMTFLVASFNYGQYKQYGGGYVAESVGAWQVDPNTREPRERQLLNIVEEMALAANLPVPPVYIIPARQINAFAAGITPENAAIAVTEGTLHRLNRDELQGVIAHEFGHIYNGDMKISMRLAAMVMGFFFIMYFGLRILQFSGLRRRSSNERSGGNPIAIAALIFVVAGIFTWFAGTLLKCIVSREREYLADACSVQFTRNPEGLLSALKKISNETYDDMPKEGSAFSHMYLDEHSGWSSLFATHPPLSKRIAAIEGQKYSPEPEEK